VIEQLEIRGRPAYWLSGGNHILRFVDADGNARQLVANPVQFDETPPTLARAPQFAEHTDEILRELGKSEDEIVQLKIEGGCT